MNMNFKAKIPFAIILISLFIRLPINAEIPEKYQNKISSTLPNCSGEDYKKWNECLGEYEFPRIHYKGEWKNGKFHGKGILKEAWGDIYVGDFKNNLAHGYGRQEDPDGGYWEGEIKNDQLNGKAIWVTAEGDIYEGNFKDGLLNGQGTAKLSDGSVYTGNFVNDRLNGKGTVKLSDGRVYTGNFVNDKLNGKGKLTYKTGAIEEGIFKNDKLHGKGKEIFKDGSIREGVFVDGFLEGVGREIYSDGDIYEGNFVKGDWSGKGKFTSVVEGYVYVGSFKKNKFHGKGNLKWIDGPHYIGDFIEGFRSGNGEYIYESGTVYKGQFVKNESEGKGQIKYANGDKYVGEFSDGYENGLGQMNYENGDIYVGAFKDGYPHGKGKMNYANGKIYEGLWENGNELKGKTTLAKFTTNEKYYALIIGNNNYDKHENLDNAVNDAKDLEKVLREKYGFDTTLLLDVNAEQTREAIIQFTQNRKKTDNILIYYAGHGQLVKKQNRGYWLPIDAGKQLDSKWINNNNIKDWITSSEAKHILVIADSCFSGSLMRGTGSNRSVEKLTKGTIDRLQKLKSRIAITSGGNEFVADGLGDAKNSVFAEPLIKALKNNNDVIRSIELFQTVQTYVINNADQTPNHSLIHGTGHDGGEFLFFPKL